MISHQSNPGFLLNIIIRHTENQRNEVGTNLGFLLNIIVRYADNQTNKVDNPITIINEWK